MKTENESRSKHVVLARGDCPKCQGAGLVSPEETCGCVYRSIFRIVLRKVRDIAIGAHHMRPMCLLGASGPQGRSGNGRKLENFSADVYLTAKRALQRKVEWDMFRYHHLLGADWKLCCKQIGLPYHENKHRKLFFDRCYRIEAKLGRVFATLTPYALYPLDEYFKVVTGRGVDVRAIPVPDARHPNGVPLRAPLAEHVPQSPAPLVPLPPKPAPVLAMDALAIATHIRHALVPLPPKPAPVPAMDALAIATHIRDGFRAGGSLWSISRQLSRLGIPGPNGAPRWKESDIKRVLLSAPREKTARPRLRKAA